MTNHSTATTGTHVAIEVVDRSQSTAFALIHELRAETRAAIEAALVLAEKPSALAAMYTSPRDGFTLATPSRS